MLESEGSSFEEISAEVGYENQAFFRSLFKRSTGLTPRQYRRMFRPIATATGLPAPPQPAAA
jgi:YesN/AraC family two-component response regulator